MGLRKYAFDKQNRSRYNFRAVRDKLKKTELSAALASAENELAAALERIEHLRMWIAVTRQLCGRLPKGSAPSESPAIPIKRRTKGSALASQVAEILRARGTFLHVDEIVGELGKNGHPVTAKNPRATVAIFLGRRTDQFVKVAPNTFGLIESATRPTLKEANF